MESHASPKRADEWMCVAQLLAYKVNQRGQLRLLIKLVRDATSERLGLLLC